MRVRVLLVVVSLLVLAPRGQANLLREAVSEAAGSVVIAGRKIDYKSTASRLVVVDKTGVARASMFFTAYTKNPPAPAGSRPLAFCFNGGPGSSSVWLHLGAFGPRRVLMSEDGTSVPQPVKLVENEFSLLDLADLVFIDPISTGFSRADDPKEAKLFHGVEEDIQSVGEFIRQYLTKYSRSDSPVFLVGESYGTTRAAGLATYLQNKGGVKLAGIVLVSAVLDFSTIRFDAGNDLPYSLFLPTYTASAWHHKKLDKEWAKDLPSILKDAQQFADGEYLVALRKGSAIGEDERNAVAKKVAKFTGISEKEVLKTDLRIEATRFRRELLRDCGEMIGRLDSRVKAKVAGGGGKGGKVGGADPASALITPPYSESIKSYLPDVLGYKTELKYQASNAPVQPWNYSPAGSNRYVNVAPRLKAAMDKDKTLRVFVANGYCDLATPFAATEYTFARLPRSINERVTMAYYEAGHMMYTHLPSIRQLRDDLAKFMAPAPAAE